VEKWMGGAWLWIERMLLRNDMTMERMDWISWKCGTIYDETIRRGARLWR